MKCILWWKEGKAVYTRKNYVNEYAEIKKIRGDKGGTSLNRKYKYINCLIRFLELYAKNELGAYEIDMQKVLLYVNSPNFENVVLPNIKTTRKIYKDMELGILNNIPFYRFFKIPNKKMQMLEREHRQGVQEEYKELSKEYPCYKCIWLDEKQLLPSNCKCLLKEKIESQDWYGRPRSKLAIRRQRNCKMCTTVDKVPSKLQTLNIYESIEKEIEVRKEIYINKLKNMDNCTIPLYIEDLDKVYIDTKEDILEDIRRESLGYRTLEEVKESMRKGMYLKCVINFVEIYAQIEIGTDYQTNITQVAKYVDRVGVPEFKTEDECYKYFEELILTDTINITKFIEKKVN